MEWTELYADCTGRVPHCLVWDQHDRHPLLAPCYKQRLLSALFLHLALFSVSHPSRQCCLYCFHSHPSRQCCLYCFHCHICSQCCLFCFHCHIHPGSAVCVHSCTRTIKYHHISMHQLLFLLSHPVRDPLSFIPTRLEIQSGIPVKVNTQSGIPAKLDIQSGIPAKLDFQSGIPAKLDIEFGILARLDNQFSSIPVRPDNQISPQTRLRQ